MQLELDEPADGPESITPLLTYIRTYPHVCHRLRVNKIPVRSGTAVKTHCTRPSGLIQAGSEEEPDVARAWGLRFPDGHPCATRVPPQCRPSATRLPPACHPGHVRTDPPNATRVSPECRPRPPELHPARYVYLNCFEIVRTRTESHRYVPHSRRAKKGAVQAMIHMVRVQTICKLAKTHRRRA